MDRRKRDASWTRGGAPYTTPAAGGEAPDSSPIGPSPPPDDAFVAFIDALMKGNSARGRRSSSADEGWSRPIHSYTTNVIEACLSTPDPVHALSLAYGVAPHGDGEAALLRCAVEVLGHRVAVETAVADELLLDDHITCINMDHGGSDHATAALYHLSRRRVGGAVPAPVDESIHRSGLLIRHDDDGRGHADRCRIEDRRAWLLDRLGAVPWTAEDLPQTVPYEFQPYARAYGVLLRAVHSSDRSDYVIEGYTSLRRALLSASQPSEVFRRLAHAAHDPAWRELFDAAFVRLPSHHGAPSWVARLPPKLAVLVEVAATR